MHLNDVELEDDFLDWFFMSKFGKDPGYWRGLSDEMIIALTTLEKEEENTQWERLAKMLGAK